MNFRDSISYKCFKSVCFLSLLISLTVITIFLAGYIINVLITLISGDYNLGQGLGWLIIVVPTILATLISIVIFAIANGYLGFIFYLEYVKKEQNMPIGIVDKVEHIFNKLFKNDFYKKIAFILSTVLYIFNFLILAVNFYAIFVGLIFFVILLIKYKLKK